MYSSRFPHCIGITERYNKYNFYTNSDLLVSVCKAKSLAHVPKKVTSYYKRVCLSRMSKF